MTKDSFIAVYKGEIEEGKITYLFDTKPMKKEVVDKLELKMICGYINPSPLQTISIINTVHLQNIRRGTEEGLLRKIDEIIARE